jgi:hypothetical protein
MPAGVGVDLGAVQADRAKPRELILPCHLQHLHKGRFELLAKPLAKARQSIVVRVQVAGDVAKRQGIVRLARSILRLEKVPVA